MCPRGARLLAGRGRPARTTRLVCHCLLIEGAEGLVLVDTGFGERRRRASRASSAAVFNARRPPAADRRRDGARSADRARGFEPGDVRHIVTTHLDLDHSGGLPDFPEAEVHLLGSELAAALQPSLRDAHPLHRGPLGPRSALGRARGRRRRVVRLRGVRILPGSDAEILMIPLPGHTRGHTGVAVRDGDGWLLHCGDAYFRHSEVQTPPNCPPGLRAFQALTWPTAPRADENLERLRELAARHGDEVGLFCSHDPATLLDAACLTGDPAAQPQVCLRISS